jgi:FkbM family methyltransferase
VVRRYLSLCPNGYKLLGPRQDKEMKRIINSILGKLDARVVRKSSFDKLVANESAFRDYELEKLINTKAHFLEFFENLPESKSQLRQDLFVLSELGFKRDGFFVEFGATNGIDLSNSYLLENKFGWSGILAEPARIWHKELLNNRNVAIETNCVWRSSGDKLRFNEVDDPEFKGELSTIDSFSDSDEHSVRRKSGKKYEVETISLNDLLVKHGAPKQIDYLSVDTEGSEFEIMNAFDFDSFDIKVITCEHNYTNSRKSLYELFTRNGYERKLPDFSLFDDWYVRL